MSKQERMDYELQQLDKEYENGELTAKEYRNAVACVEEDYE